MQVGVATESHAASNAVAIQPSRTMRWSEGAHHVSLPTPHRRVGTAAGATEKYMCHTQQLPAGVRKLIMLN